MLGQRSADSHNKLTASRPGDQHAETAATTNPFVEQKPRMSEYSAQQIATLQSRLDRQLGPEYISTRAGPGGGKLHYLAADKAINLANEVFGFNGWSSSIQNVQIDFVDEQPQTGKITLGLSTIVRVTLRDGTSHEDIGYGHIENCKGKAAAFEKAKKEAVTDAMKRALRNFGNVLGNCLYDKDYLARISKVKVVPSKWDAENLHRHPDYAPIKQESHARGAQHQAEESHNRRQISMQSFGSAEFEDDFGCNTFDDTDFSHPDMVRLDETPSRPGNSAIAPAAQQRQGVPRMHSMPHMRPPNVQPPAPMQNPQSLQKPQDPPRPSNEQPQVPQHRMLPPQAGSNQQQRPSPPQSVIAGQSNSDGSGAKSNPSSATTIDATSLSDSQHRPPNQYRPPPSHALGHEFNEQSLPAPSMPPPGAPEGFVTGRSVDLLNQPPSSRPPNAALAFNPNADSPSIRRTHGINHAKTAPITRQSINGAPALNAQAMPTANGNPGTKQQPQQAATNGGEGATAPLRTNFVNPAADMNRRIGMPPGAPNAAQNRGSYKPPTAVKRPPLSDVSNIQQTDGASDAKKPKLDATVAPTGEAENAAPPSAVS